MLKFFAIFKDGKIRHLINPAQIVMVDVLARIIYLSNEKVQLNMDDETFTSFMAFLTQDCVTINTSRYGMLCLRHLVKA